MKVGYMKEAGVIIIDERNYVSAMEEKVIPYLTERRKIFFLEREAGKKLYCVSYRADTPRGVILISHGFTETAEKYLEPVYYFLKMNFHVFCVEHCGHGRSYRLADDLSLVHTDSFDRYVNDLVYTAEFAKRTYPDLPLFLYAHSMGGGIGAAAASIYPGLFKKAVLSSPMIRPLTGNIPWTAAQITAGVFCMAGKERDYVMGQKPYDGQEQFEDSAATSRARFEYYRKKRDADPLFQMNAASYGWLVSAGQLNHFLMRKSCRMIRTPLLIFQAEKETFVSNKETETFAKKCSQNTAVSLVKILGAKHEIYQSGNRELEEYWSRICRFLS